jgi:hypothetical protein
VPDLRPAGACPVIWTYYLSGDWAVECETCGARYVTRSISDAWKRQRAHTNTCTQMGAPRANENTPTNPRKDQ